MDTTAITLAILSVFVFVVQGLAVIGRVYHRIQSNKYAAKDLRVGAVGWSLDDYLIFVAYGFAIINWGLVTWAGFEGLGSDEMHNDELVQTLILPIEALSITSSFLAKASFALLLTRIASTQTLTSKFSRLLCVVIATVGGIAAFVVVVPCWAPMRDATCLKDSYRWICLATVDVVTELLIMGFPLYALRDIQFRSKGQRWKFALLIIVGRCCVVPLAISFCVVILRSIGDPFLGSQILDAFERQQGGLFASLITSTLVPVFNLFQITKIEVFESSVELNITKTVDVRVDVQKRSAGLESSAASLSQSTRELLDQRSF